MVSDPGPDGAAWAVESLLAARHDRAALERAADGVRRFPDHGDSWRVLAKALTVTGDLDRALEAAHRSIALDPASARAHKALSLVLARRADDGAAVDAMRRATELDPSDAWARVALVDLLLRGIGRLDPDADATMLTDCMAQLDAGLATDPGLAPLHFQMAKLAIVADDDAAAMHWVTSGLAIDPEGRVGHQQLGILARRRGDLDGAERHFLDAGTVDPRQAAWSSAALTDLDHQRSRSRARRDVRSAAARHRDRS